MAELSDDELLAELGVAVETKKAGARTPREERIIAGFEDIVQFRGGAWPRAPAWRGPRHLRAALCRAAGPLREQPDCRAFLAALDASAC